MQNLQNQPKQRHGCVSAWLIVMMVIYSISTYWNLLYTSSEYSLYRLGVPKCVYFLLAAICVINIIFAVFIFKWKRWAFWGFLVTTLMTAGINMYAGDNLAQALVGVFGIAVLFATMQIKEREKSAWDNLE